MNGTESASFASAVLMFNWVEYSVFCSMLLLSLLIGIYFGYFQKQDTVAKYMLGGRTMGVIPIALSQVFSHVSGVSLVGLPAEIYVFGSQYAAIFLPITVTVLLVNYVFLPVFYRLQLNSLYEYLELRFSRGTRTLGSMIFALNLVISAPLVIYVPALAFNQVTGVNVHIVTPAVMLICIFYTSIGGLKAVVWTDAVQGAFTLGSNFFIIGLGLVSVGGLTKVLETNERGGRLELFNMNPSPFERNTFWTVAVGSLFHWVSQHAVHPGAMQRFIAVSSEQKAKAVMICSFVGFVIIKIVIVLEGLLLYTTFHDCDPIATKMVQKSGQLLPYYVIQVAKDYPGLTGLFISGVLSAALSTMSAKLNTVAGTIYEDIIKFFLRGKKQSEAKQALALKVITLVLGIISICLVFIVERLGALYQMVVSLNGFTSGALVGIFSLGVLFPRANYKGAISGALASLVVMSGIVFGAQMFIARGLLKFPGKSTSVEGCTADFLEGLHFNASALVQTYRGVGTPVAADPAVPLLFQLSYKYYTATGTLVTIVVGLVVSLLSAPPDPQLDPRLLAPCVRRFLPPRDTVQPAEELKLMSSRINGADVIDKTDITKSNVTS